MKQLARALPSLFLLVLGISSSSAQAGVLGSTSRATVTISVTVPPRIVLDHSRPARERAVIAHGENLCIRTTGLTSYHVTLIPTDGGSPAIDLQSIHLGELADDQDWCGRDLGLGAAVHLDKRMMQAIAGSAGPATLLIVPE